MLNIMVQKLDKSKDKKNPKYETIEENNIFKTTCTYRYF